MTDTPHQRQIRSFVRRAGRQTPAQDRALTELWPRFGLPPAIEGLDPRLDLAQAFGRQAPGVLEIGFGNGDALVQMAANAPERNFLGVEVHAPGVGHCLLAIERLGLSNVRLLMEDAVGVLATRLPEQSLLGTHLYFPDPWHKKGTTNDGWCRLSFSPCWRPDWLLKVTSMWPRTGPSMGSTLGQ